VFLSSLAHSLLLDSSMSAVVSGSLALAIKETIRMKHTPL